MKTQVQIRQLEAADLEQGFFETLENLAPVGDLSFEKARALLQGIISDPNHYIFVAISDNQVVGALTLLVEQKFTHRGGRIGHIEDVATRKEWERQGISRRLHERAFKVAKERNCYKVVLDCNPKLIPFYEKLGFHVWQTGMRIFLLPPIDS
jgi:glucosamine-phosphate N-acetyltransferase